MNAIDEKLKKFIEWSDKYNCNVQVIDEQHKQTIDLANELHRHLGESYNWRIESIMKRLIEHLRIHFDTEEFLMKSHKYESYISHKLEHDRYYKKVQSYETALKEGNEVISLEFLNSLRTWFRNHLRLNDQKLGKYLSNQEIK
ncbi:MAG: bacteriohemerythrin [Ignavibacteria bacterium]|jgi:hemerythrin